MSKRAKISTELVDFLEGGVPGWAATSDGLGNPDTARVFGAKIREKGGALTVYLPTASSGQALRNLDAKPELALFFVAIGNYRALQVKGEVVAVREGRVADRKIQEAYRHKFVAQAVSIGIPEAVISRIACWPSTAVEVAVRELYVQTPGPGAGEPWR